MTPNKEKEQKLLEEQLKKKEMRLKTVIPVLIITVNTDKRMKYLKKDYFLYRTYESTLILTKGRNIKVKLDWINLGSQPHFSEFLI